MSDIPDRSGWLTGSLATLPPVPPFPELTEFEQRVLAVLAELFGPETPTFRAQVAACKVTDRVNTIVGFYTRIFVDRAAAEPLSITHKGGHFDVAGTHYGMVIVLWDDDGYLSTMEGTTYGEDDLGGQELERLAFTDFQLS